MQASGYKMFRIILFTFLLLFNNCLYAEESVSKLEKVTIAYLPITNALPLYLAIEEGLFKKHGIEAEIVKFQAGNQLIDTLLANRADVGGPAAGTGITLVASEKYPESLKVALLNGSVGQEVVSTEISLLALTTSPINAISDLKGKNVGIPPGIQWRTLIKRIIRKNGLDSEKDVRLVEVPVQQHITALLSGSLDATLSLEPTGAIAEASGKAKRVEKSIGTKYLTDPFYPGVTVLSSDFVNKRPKIAAALVKALDEAVEEIRKSPEGKKQLFEKYLNMNKDQIKFLGTAEYVTNKELIERKKTAKDKLYDPVADFQKIADIFLEEGVLRSRVDVSELIYRNDECENP